VSALWKAAGRLIYENKRKANLVSGHEIWLGLGAALCLAGLGCNCGIYGFARRISGGFASRQAFRSLDCGDCSPGGCLDYHLPRKRGETALALGKGLGFAHDDAAKQIAINAG